MPRLSASSPKYRKHRASGQAIVTISGQDVYLGPYGSKRSRDEYDRIVGEWLAAGRRLPSPPEAMTVAEVVAAWRRYALANFRTPDGSVSRDVANTDEALRPVLLLYGRTPAVEFGPLALKAVRQKMIDAGRVRANINRLINRIRAVFAWAVSQELLPVQVHQALCAVKGLRAGRCTAKEGKPVKPVAAEHVEDILPHVAPQVVAMIRLQQLSGMRPGEVTIMRGCDIDTTGTLWSYRPAKHKTLHRGHERIVYLGRKAQDVLRPFLKTDLAAYLFSPREAEQQRREKLHATRRTPLSCGNVPGSNRRRRPKREPGELYSVSAYYLAIRRGCELAYPPPAPLAKLADETHKAWKRRLTPEQGVELRRWRRQHSFHPHQIRHTTATDLRKQYGLEAAQVILGHKTLSATQLYAEKNVEAARQIMEAVG